ncbi:hypothetical protein PSN45_001691 [Yamadazyma tenuis]|uniref:Uncharacterized protein n=1 Tax=Candida tenuis (strain ATCC 10573 / BCRC 21748 / CBS 615 / JCM 9827 / NBRC 10315 / NRRL Y-1498 / VKM Y-70) TaxID=590646 RepID=G3BEH8_CANTC|nr:uncharacterized protein CANTEDRAFT_116625 [Yamadazyma tenuis ATCC 10573]EGV60547.1 hypothetical protein CANTEDRAFT_116625 [Yamadazyma tenuis ATCC 10573]WEJ94211.1 hypothetical protein PSN45_001691 [Yamadazyma tenuis]
MNTSIIISELSRQDFIKTNHPMSLVDQIKLEILNIDYQGDEDYYLNKISTWSNLPFLSRVIIILKDEESSKQLYHYINSEIRSKYHLDPGVKVTLQENLLQRSKSFDGSTADDDSLSVNMLKRFKAAHSSETAKYQEPKPQIFDVFSMHRLGLHPQEADAEAVTASDGSSMARSRSMTRTLFKPPLSIETNLHCQSSMPSPTITLDETN